MATAELTMGPVLFHWPEQQKRDFWFRVADEAPVDTVYLGEVVCSKRAPFFDHHIEEVADRLKRGGKRVIWSTLAEVVSKHDRKITESFCTMDDVEANDVSALNFLSGKPHRIGQYLNVYNEETVRHLAKNGANHFCLAAELPLGHCNVNRQQSEIVPSVVVHTDWRCAISFHIFMASALSSR